MNDVRAKEQFQNNFLFRWPRAHSFSLFPFAFLRLNLTKVSSNFVNVPKISSAEQVVQYVPNLFSLQYVTEPTPIYTRELGWLRTLNILMGQQQFCDAFNKLAYPGTGCKLKLIFLWIDLFVGLSLWCVSNNNQAYLYKCEHHVHPEESGMFFSFFFIENNNQQIRQHFVAVFSNISLRHSMRQIFLWESSP